MSVYKSTDGRKVYVDCDCGCGDAFKLEAYDWSDVEVAGLRFFNPNVHTFREKLYRIWCAIFHHNYYVVDVLMEYKDWKDFVKYVNKIDKFIDNRRAKDREFRGE